MNDKVELNRMQENQHENRKILLSLMPYWDPMIPPTGIACLKGYLEKYGYVVRTIDPNTEKVFRTIYHDYFETLKNSIPEGQRGNFFNIGHEVLRNQMMAYLHHSNRNEYIELVKAVVYKHYYTEVNEIVIDALSIILKKFFQHLEKYILEWIAKEQPGVFGLTVYTGTLPASLFAFKTVREKYPDIVTVMGGGVFSEHLLENSESLEFFKEQAPFIDKMIIGGEGEELFLKYLQGEIPALQRVITKKDILPKYPEEQLFQVPDYSDFNTRKYPYLAVSGSFSCPYKCSFCNIRMYWGEYKRNETRKIVEEMTLQYEKYRCQLFYMNDSILNPNITELADIIIQSDKTFYYDAFLKVDKQTCDVKNTLHWRCGGLYRARLGIECGSQRLLDLMEKPITIEQVKLSLSNLAHAGIKTTCFWIIGHPGETEEDFQKTLDVLEELKEDIYEAECAPFMYFYNAQNSGQKWLSEFSLLPLFPPEARSQLFLQSYILDCNPSREETFRRLWRAIAHIDRLGIPNPYSMFEIHKADMRWKQLHSNAAPFLLEFQSRDRYIDECRAIKN